MKKFWYNQWWQRKLIKNNKDEASEPFRSDRESWKGDSSDKEEICDDRTEGVVSDEEDMNGFSNKDVEYDKDSTDECDSYNDGGTGVNSDLDR